MSSLNVLAIQILVPLTLGILANVYLRGVTRQVLADLCSGIDRGEFWVRVVALLSTLSPLVVVLIFGRSTGPAGGDAIGDLIRHTLSLSLIGILVAVAVLARTVWKQIPKPATEAVSPRSA